MIAAARLPLRSDPASNQFERPSAHGRDLLLPVQRQVVSELRHHHVRQQACGRDALVDHLGRHWCLDQCFALAAGPFPTHVLLDGEQARRVIQLLADVLANALKLAATGALGVFRFVVDHGAWELRR